MRTIRVLKWFPFEKKLNGLACKETAKRYYKDIHTYEWYAEGNWKLLLNVKIRGIPRNFQLQILNKHNLALFLWHVIKLRNSLPKHIVEEVSINGFEKILEDFRYLFLSCIKVTLNLGRNGEDGRKP